jgi:hypothetical protein
MLDVSKLVLADLPGVSAESIRDLPETSAVYFIVCSYGVVHYVGQSKRLRSRLKNHRRLAQVENREGLMVRYLAVQDSELRDAEVACIAQFAPLLNDTKDPLPAPRPKRLDRYNETLMRLDKEIRRVGDPTLSLAGPMWFVIHGGKDLDRVDALIRMVEKAEPAAAVSMMAYVFSVDFEGSTP